MFNVNVGFNKNKYQDKLSKSVTLRVKIISKNIKKVKKEIKKLEDKYGYGLYNIIQ